jgi:hypothetical protein
LKKKNRNAIKGLKESLEQHEKETTYGAVEVDKEELRTLLRWAQNKSHHYFEGDRVKATGASVPFRWLEMDMEGTVIAESDDKSICRVEWEGGPADDGENRVMMYHNEIRLA